MRRISSGQPIYYNRSKSTSVRQPVKVSDLFKAVQEATKDVHKTKSYFVHGERQLNFDQIIEILEKAAGKKAKLNECKMQSTFKPDHFGLVQDLLYTQCYINSQGIIHSGRTGKDISSKIEDGSKLISQAVNLEDFYTADSFTNMKAHNHTWMKRFLFY